MKILVIILIIWIACLSARVAHYKEKAAIYETKFHECLAAKPVIDNSFYPMVIK